MQQKSNCEAMCVKYKMCFHLDQNKYVNQKIRSVWSKVHFWTTIVGHLDADLVRRDIFTTN